MYTWKLHTAAAVRRPAPAEDRGQCQLRAQRSRLPPAPPAAPAAPAAPAQEVWPGEGAGDSEAGGGLQ